MSSTRSRCCQPQQVMLEVRFVEATRQAGRELGVQWNVFGQLRMTANIGSRQQAEPSADPPRRPASTNIPLGEVAAGVLSGGQPFGFMLGRMLTGGIDGRRDDQRARGSSGLARTLAEPNLVGAVGRYRELPGRRRISDPGRRASHRPADHRSNTSATASASPSRRPCWRRPDQPEDRAGGQPARPQPIRCRSAADLASRR